MPSPGPPPGTRSATGPIARRMARNWPTKCRHYLAWSRPSGVRAQLPTVRLNGTRRDPAGTGYEAVSCGNTRPKGAVPDAQSPPPRNPGRAGYTPLTCPDLAHNWPTTGPQAPGAVPRTAPWHTSGPACRPGLTWGYAWQVLGSNQRRRMPAILQGAHSRPSEWPLTCGYSIPRRVKTAFCPRGVRNPGVCLVSVTQVLDHVPRSPAECHCVHSCCHRPSSASARQSLRHRPAAADGRRQARHIAAPQKSGPSGHFPRPCHGFRPRPARRNRPARSHLAPADSSGLLPIT